MTFVEIVGLIGAVAMPFWNIPLILRIWKRKSSEDISAVWVTGIWICVLLMLPSSIYSQDPVLKTFGIVNAISFTFVFFTVLKYRK
ncbi:MAG: hypothetical protein HYS58_03505 [Elusimicrobia bacterium]|nr:hypothetical protein [Elusimicrobiota bacterium]MBI4217909.1 hypothetical protein [Elusimicrobiota bacterium]